MQRYGDQPSRDDKERIESNRRGYRDRSKDYYSYDDDDPYFGGARSDR